MLRRLHPDQPDNFAFTPVNQDWANAQLTKFPKGRQASAIIPLLWRAQEQEGWLTRPAIEHVADMLGMPYIRALEVATFYFMFQLQPVGTVAHIQICGTTSCMICGAEDLIGVCKRKIAENPHELSADGKFSWEEVECLGACANAPMAQIGKDYYEDLTEESLADLLDRMAAGEVPTPGPQNGRFASEPAGGLTSLDKDVVQKLSASAQLATDFGDTVKRIDGTEAPIITGWLKDGTRGGRPDLDGNTEDSGAAAQPKASTEKSSAKKSGTKRAATKPKADANAPAKPAAKAAPKPAAASKKAGSGSKAKAAVSGDYDKDGVDEGVNEGTKPATLSEARAGGADDLKKIKGVGPKLESLLHRLGFFHFDQVAAWTSAEVAWVDANLEGFRGRVSRDNWVEQAKLLASGGETEFSKKVDKGGVY